MPDVVVDEEDAVVVPLGVDPSPIVIAEPAESVGVIAIPSAGEPIVVASDVVEPVAVQLSPDPSPAVVVVGESLPVEVVLTPPVEDAAIIGVSGGLKGDPGPAGEAGPDGHSAYDMAVMDGFVGTPEEWLASLQGPAGEPAPVQIQSYVHVQATPSAEWMIHHDLPFQPGGITTTDSAGSEVIGNISVLDPHTIKITFASGFSGTARLS